MLDKEVADHGPGLPDEDEKGKGLLDRTTPKILIVDDEKAIQRFLRNALSGGEFALHEAETGWEALAAAAQLRPDLIILDLGLPDMDGLEVIDRLREWTRIPVIVLTVRERESDKLPPSTPGPTIT